VVIKFLLVFIVLTTITSARENKILINRFSSNVMAERYMDGFYNNFCSNVIKKKGLELVDHKLFKEMKKEIDTTSCTTDLCLIDVAKILGIDLIVTGEISTLKDDFTFSLKLIDVQTASVVNQIYRVYKGDFSNIIKDSSSVLLEAIMRVKPTNVISKNPLINIKQGEKSNLLFKFNPSYSYEKLNFNYDKNFISLNNKTIIALKPGETKLSFHSVLDSTINNSVKIVINEPNIRHSLISKKNILRTSIGVVSVISVSLGLIKNGNLSKLQKQYDEAEHESDLDIIKDDINSTITVRNISYTTALLSAIGLGLTFKF